METRNKVISGNDNTHIEISTIIFKGKEYTNYGSFISKDKKGKYGGIMYRCNGDKHVTSWDGEIKWNVLAVTPKYKDNFGGTRQHLYIQGDDGRVYIGRHYGMDWSDIVRLTEIKKLPKEILIITQRRLKMRYTNLSNIPK